MKALKRKWNSSQGASILLALLFLLICMMAGASVVMAAASNAGKIRSNKDEQQKYLTLVSAVTLLCDELQSVEYVGRYTITTAGPLPDEREDRLKPGRAKDGEYKIEDYGDDDYYKTTTYTYTWLEGKLQAREDGAKIKGSDDWTRVSGNLKEVLPLFDNWEYSFATEQFSVERSFPKKENRYEDNVVYEYKNDLDTRLKTPQGESYTLTLTVGGSSETVYVTVTSIGQNKRDSITLEAHIEGYPLVVKATLEPTGGRGPRNIKLSEPPGQLENITIWTPNYDPEDKLSYTYTGETEAVTWELVAIEKVQK